MSATKPPKAAPVAAFTAVIIALLLIALAVVGIHDLIVTQGWGSGMSWSRAMIDDTDGASRADWVLPLAALVLLLGLFLLVASFTPRRSTHQHVPGQGHSVDVWIAPAALAKLATSAAQDAPGVLSARSKVSGRRINVRVGTTPGSDPDQTDEAASKLVTERIGDLSALPVKVHAKEVGK